MVRAIIYDWDGVLLNSLPRQFSFLEHICGVYHIPFPFTTLEDYRRALVEPFPEFYKSLGFDWGTLHKDIHREYRQWNAQHHAPLFDGIKEMLDGLDGLLLAIASSNTEENIKRELDRENLRHRFVSIIGHESVPETHLKPNPEVILQTLHTLKLHPNEAVYVGDQPCDIAASRNVGLAHPSGVPMRVIAVTQGYATREKLEEHKPDHLVDDRRDIVKIVNSYRARNTPHKLAYLNNSVKIIASK
jgi:phosphoglycolate phosphatase